jgi:hypothetical protein
VSYPKYCDHYCPCSGSCEPGCEMNGCSMTENQETLPESSNITASISSILEGDGKPSAALSTEIVSLVEEFLSGMEPTDVWHVTLRATSSR